jgi:hypothetical protein
VAAIVIQDWLDREQPHFGCKSPPQKIALHGFWVPVDEAVEKIVIGFWPIKKNGKSCRRGTRCGGNAADLLHGA